MDLGFLILVALFGAFIGLLYLRFYKTKDRNVLFLILSFSILELGFIVRAVTSSLSIYIDSQIFAIASSIFIVLFALYLVYEILQKKIHILLLSVLSFLSFFIFLVLGVWFTGNNGIMELLVWIRELIGMIVILLFLVHLFRFRDVKLLFLFVGYISLLFAAFLFNTTDLTSFIASLTVGAIFLIAGEFIHIKQKQNKDKNVNSIRYKISFVIFSLVIIALGAISGYGYYITSSRIDSEFKRDIDVLAHTKVENIQTLIRSYVKISTGFGEEILFNEYVKFDEAKGEYNLNNFNLNKRSESFIELNDSIYKVKLLNADGIVIYSTDENDIGIDKSGEDYYTESNQSVVISDIHLSKTTNKLGFDIAIPMLNKKNDLSALLVVDYYAEELFNILVDRTGMGETGEFYLVNDDFFVMSPSRYFDNNSLTLKDQSIVTEDCFDKSSIDDIHSLEGNNITLASDHTPEDVVSTYRGYRGDLVLGTHIYLTQSSWCFVANIDQSELRDPINAVLITYLIISVLVVFMSGLMSSYVSKKISRPIRELQDGVEIIEKGDHSYKVGTDDKDEIGELSRAFDKMTIAINESKKDVNLKVQQQTQEIVGQRDKMISQQKAVLNILEDVEEEKQKSVELANDLKKFQLAVANASDHIVITDAEGMVLYANKAVEKITGYSMSEVVGKKAGNDGLWGGLMSKEFYEKFWKTIKINKKTFSGLVDNRRKNGEKYTVFGSISPVLNDDGEVKFFVGIERDVTKEQEIDKAKTEFVSLASHQLRTPLSAINWYTEMLIAGDVGKLKKNQLEFMEEIYKGNKRMVELVNSLLNVSRIELGTFAIDPEETNIAELSSIITKELEPQIKKKKITFIQKISKQIPLMSVDPKLLSIVFQNLLSNAIKYTPEKGKVVFTLKKMKKDLYIEVTDTGYGIPKKQQASIFTKLFRADNVRSRDTEGTGLGLYIVRSILDQSGGSITFTSIEDKGTTFTAKIPLSGMKKKSGTKGLAKG